MHAQAAAEYVLRNNISGCNPEFYSLITAIYVLYGKPFLSNYGVGPLEEGIIPAEYLALHRTLLIHRNETYAHSEAKNAFEFPDAGKVNQVRLLVRPPKSPSLICSQFQAEPPLLPIIINLCQQLQEKTDKQKKELFKRYEKYVPTEEGEYVLNVDDPKSGFFKPAKPVKPVIG